MRDRWISRRGMVLCSFYPLYNYASTSMRGEIKSRAAVLGMEMKAAKICEQDGNVQRLHIHTRINFNINVLAYSE